MKRKVMSKDSSGNRCYKIEYNQVLVGVYHVEADSPEAAEKLFKQALDADNAITEGIMKNLDVGDETVSVVAGPEKVSDWEVDVPPKRYW